MSRRALGSLAVLLPSGSPPPQRSAPAPAARAARGGAAGLLVVGLLAAAGCDPASTEFRLGPRTDQVSQPHFPTGVAVRPGGGVLAVVSSNFDSRYDSGALLLVDLDEVDAQVASLPRPAGSTDFFDSTPVVYDRVYLQSFGNRPVFSADGERVVVSTRGDNRINEVRLIAAEDDGGPALPLLDCSVGLPANGEPATCGTGDFTLDLGQNDPYDLLLFDDEGGELLGVSTFLQSSQVAFFRLRTGRTGPARIQLQGVLELGEEVIGVRGAALYPRGGSQTPLVLVAWEGNLGTAATQRVKLAWFDPAARSDAQVRDLNVTELTGAESVRSVAVTPDGDGLLLLQRAPDSLARFDVERVGGTIRPRLGGLGPSCDDPTDLEIVRLSLPGGGSVDRALVACHADDTVAAFDPLTLSQTDAVRFLGRGPFDLAVDPTHSPPRAYVTFFFDDSVGVIDLIDEGGVPRLVPRGIIGIPNDREELR